MLALIRTLAAFAAAAGLGRLISKIKLPAILGWLLAGMILGPHALNLLNQETILMSGYQRSIHILECTVGLLIGTELIWKKIKSSGSQIIWTTLTQSLGTFFFVTLVFGITFYYMGIPLYLAALFGGIALATAPAPALSIVREFKTKGPVTDTLIPMAALDDMVGVIVFFSVMTAVSGYVSADSMPLYMIPAMIVLPVVIGAGIGGVSGYLMKRQSTIRSILLNLVLSILAVSCLGIFINEYIFGKDFLNFMLMGMAYSIVFANMIPEKELNNLMKKFSPVLGAAIIVVIVNLGAPLDYHLIFGAGIFTAIYIVARAFGKYFGARIGASCTHAPETVRRYLGFTLLPHSGVSLVFTGIAASALSGPAPECAQIIQGTIAAAAVINEIIAVIMAKKGFEWAGEIGIEETNENTCPESASY